jgi:hypothetical protein
MFRSALKCIFGIGSFAPSQSSHHPIIAKLIVIFSHELSQRMVFKRHIQSCIVRSINSLHITNFVNCRQSSTFYYTLNMDAPSLDSDGDPLEVFITHSVLSDEMLD